MLLSAAFTFLRVYWKQIIIVLAVIALGLWIKSLITDYGDKRYLEGQNAADAKWIFEHNKTVDEHNKRVDDLKNESKRNAEGLTAQAQMREANLQKIIDDLNKRKPAEAPKTNWVPTSDTVCYLKAPATGTVVEPTKVEPGKLTMAPTLQTQPLKLYSDDTGLLNIPLGPEFVKTWNMISNLE